MCFGRRRTSIFYIGKFWNVLKHGAGSTWVAELFTVVRACQSISGLASPRMLRFVGHINGRKSNVCGKNWKIQSSQKHCEMALSSDCLRCRELSTAWSAVRESDVCGCMWLLWLVAVFCRRKWLVFHVVFCCKVLQVRCWTGEGRCAGHRLFMFMCLSLYFCSSILLALVSLGLMHSCH